MTRELAKKIKLRKYQKEYYKSHKNDYRRRIYKWRSENPEKVILIRKRFRLKARRKALSKIGNGKIECSNCGCNIYEYLEINHKKLLLKSSMRRDRGDSFMRRIIADKKRGEKYEITCRICNSLHYLIERYPNIKNNHKILWEQI